MNQSLKVAGALASLVLLAGCAEGEPEPAPTVTETATVTETVTATPDPEAAESDEAMETEENAWLQEAREEHLYALGPWYREYYDADCMAYEAECYDLVAEGLPMMQEYSDWVRNSGEDHPDYVPSRYPMDASHAAMELESWSYACPDAADCEDRALEALSSVFDVITEPNDWGD